MQTSSALDHLHYKRLSLRKIAVLLAIDFAIWGALIVLIAELVHAVMGLAL